VAKADCWRTARNDKGQAYQKASLAARLKEIKTDHRPLRLNCRVLKGLLAVNRRRKRTPDEKLWAAKSPHGEGRPAKYGKLSEDENQTFVSGTTMALATVHRRGGRASWIASPRRSPADPPVAERYATRCPNLMEVATLAAHVDEHLKKMGAVWDETRLQAALCRRDIGRMGCGKLAIFVSLNAGHDLQARSPKGDVPVGGLPPKRIP